MVGPLVDTSRVTSALRGRARSNPASRSYRLRFFPQLHCLATELLALRRPILFGTDGERVGMPGQAEVMSP